MSSLNEIWLAGERLDLDDETALLPTFQANDRTKPDTIQSDYSPEFSAPGTARNHRLLKQAAAGQGSAYARVPAVLTSGGVETLPLAMVYVKGYREGRYQLQLFGGNKRLVEALKKADGSDKKLADLDLSRFDHDWTPANILERLPFGYWQAHGYGYEVYDRGKPLDLQAVDPYTLYPGVAARLIFEQLLADAGFTADSLLAEPLFAALNVPTANAYEYSQKFRDARQLTAGFLYRPNYDLNSRGGGLLHEEGFGAEKIVFNYTDRKPYHTPEEGASYTAGRYTVDTLGFYDLNFNIPIRFGSRTPFPGSVRCFVEFRINGQSIFDPLTGAQLGKDELETDPYVTHTFTAKLERYKLKAGDYVEVWWRGDEIKSNLGISPTDPYWQIGPWGAQVGLTPELEPEFKIATEVRLTASLLPDFPPAGRVKLNEWLPDLTQLDFFKTVMLTLGLTVQADDYRPHLHLATGQRALQNIGRALDWTNRRDAFAQPGRIPERSVAFRYGSYGQVNNLIWSEDANVTKGYGDGIIAIQDEILPASYTLATLPFAATEDSKRVAGLLKILNYDVADFTATPVVYSTVEAKPRLVLHGPTPTITGKLITQPATGDTPAVLADFTTSASYFISPDLSLDLNQTVLTNYWQDLRACLDESRFLVERLRLTPRDIAQLDFSTPVWLGYLEDYFLISKVSEYAATRPVEVELIRLNAKYLPPPALPNGAGAEWYEEEFNNVEFY